MVIGIDLGTTFSVGAYVDENGEPHVVYNRDGSNTTPSVVMFDEDEILVGIQAKNNAVLDPLNVVQFVKRNIGQQDWSFDSDAGDQFSAEEISSMILKRIKEDCEKELGEPVTKAVITVPAYFSDAQRQATKDAGKLAGLEVLAIINEPTAAALAYGITQLGTQQRVMVYDLGGGTCDVTIVDINPEGFVKVLATHGNRNLGGYDFDNRMITYVADLFHKETGIDIEEDDDAMQLLRRRCEEAKIGLSSRERFRISLSAQGKKFKTEITRAKFEELIKDLVKDTEIDIEEALNDAGLQPRDIDKILLVGGSTRIPAVVKFVETRMNMKPSAELNADEVVAIGAAIYAKEIGSSTPPPVPIPSEADMSTPSDISEPSGMPARRIQDVNSHGLGVVVAIDEDGNMGNAIIIPRNQQIPAMGEDVFATRFDNQTSIKVEVTEGDDEDLSYVSIVGAVEIRLNPHPAGSPVKVELGYDSDGTITCRVFDITDNCYLGDDVFVFRRNANMTDEEIKSKTIKMNRISVR